MYRAISLLVLVSICYSTHAQPSFNWTQFLRKGSTDSTVVIAGTLNIDSEYATTNAQSVPPERSINGRIVINNPVEIYSPRIIRYDIPEEFTPHLDLTNLHFKQPVRIQISKNPILIYNCVFENGIEIMNGYTAGESTVPVNMYMGIENNEFHGQVFISMHHYAEVGFNSNTFDGNRDKFHYVAFGGTANTRRQYVLSVFDTLHVNGELMKLDDSPAIQIEFSDVYTAKFWNNTFRVPQRYTTVISTRTDITRFNNNRFEGDARISGLVRDEFVLRDNVFTGSVVLSDLDFPQRNQIEWNDIKGRLAFNTKKVVNINNIPASQYQGLAPVTTPTYTDSIELAFFYKGVSTDELVDKRNFDGLVEQYKVLFDNYKQKGNLQASNGCFVAAKELEGRRLAAIYHTEGGFKNFFGWKLNQLMKFYTNHATEPALALVISVYILLAFSVIYFFFPSEWDVESKSKLIAHYRDFIQKNDKGYFKPFLKMVGGFAMSFVNAFTLSLNAFVTLGFGNIPTRGIARYICVVQGFIGWFLLSIFTVALFNQVLF